jgi:hypothetical protein
LLIAGFRRPAFDSRTPVERVRRRTPGFFATARGLELAGRVRRSMAAAMAIKSSAPRVVLALVLAAVSAAASGCLGEGDALSLLLLEPALPQGHNFVSVNYEVVSPQLATLAFGSIDVSASNVVPEFGVVVASGNDRVVRLGATTIEGTHCLGQSKPFYLQAGRELHVDVPLSCRPLAPLSPVQPPRVGFRSDGSACPSLSSWRASPLQATAQVGGIHVAASAFDPQPGRSLTYEWAATEGTFEDLEAPATVYSCGPAGAQTLMITVSDNHQRAPCSAAVTIPVMCKPKQ